MIFVDLVWILMDLGWILVDLQWTSGGCGVDLGGSDVDPGLDFHGSWWILADLGGSWVNLDGC